MLEDRLAIALGPFDTERKRMFGGVCHMLNGNMLLGTFRNSLLVRLPKQDHAAALALPGAREMAMKGRVMEGFILVEEDALESDAVLNDWVGKALAYNATLPAKAAKASPARRPTLRKDTGKAPTRRRRT